MEALFQALLEFIAQVLGSAAFEVLLGKNKMVEDHFPEIGIVVGAFLVAALVLCIIG